MKASPSRLFFWHATVGLKWHSLILTWAGLASDIAIENEHEHQSGWVKNFHFSLTGKKISNQILSVLLCNIVHLDSPLLLQINTNKRPAEQMQSAGVYRVILSKSLNSGWCIQRLFFIHLSWSLCYAISEKVTLKLYSARQLHVCNY